MSTYSRRSRTSSPPRSISQYSASAAGPQKLNVVTRLAIEGKSKKGSDGAAIKMYLKIALPIDNITPGSTIPLFPEENLKILDSQVHPLDITSAPYNFSSTTCSLLRNAARALNLPPRSAHSYTSLFGSVSSSSTNSPLEDKYTGHILVSGYHVSYVLPKEFPTRPGASEVRNRRSASVLQFMAAIDMWVPFLSRPPQAPFLLSIPTPRCLSNNIRLHIFPPTSTSTSSSLASLSSAEEDLGPWDLTSDPHVTRSASARLARANSYNDFADDESSDSSTTVGYAGGCSVQGTFPSAEHIRVRWAAPMKGEDVPEVADGRRRVGIKDVKGDMTCTVLGKKKLRAEKEGVILKVEYTGTCTGLWFPGVATMLGMDVGLEAGDCDVSWVPGMESKWTLNGGTGFTGYSIGGLPESPQSSEAPPFRSSSPTELKTRAVAGPARNKPSSSASLLNIALPPQNTADYSFDESSPSSTPTETVSSLASLPIISSPERNRRGRAASINARYPDTDTDGDSVPSVCKPKAPITIHVNMNDLLPPFKNIFTFNISGTVLISPRSTPFLLGPSSSEQSQSDSENDPNPVVLPKFRVFYNDSETISTIVRSDVDGATVDVYNLTGNVRHAQTRKSVLQRGGHTKCRGGDARIAVRTFPSAPSYSSFRSRDDDSTDSTHPPPSRPRTPNGIIPRTASGPALRQTYMFGTPKPKRDGPLMIPSVRVTVTPLITGSVSLPNSYAVRVCLPAPSDADSEWLEFGLALAGTAPSGPPGRETLVSDHTTGLPPRVEVASASVEGVPVRFETSAAVKPESSATGARIPFDETSGKDWITWVRVHVGDTSGGNVEVIYLVKARPDVLEAQKVAERKGKHKEMHGTLLDVLLPSFSLPVGQLAVDVETQAGFELASIRTNLNHQQSLPQGRRLLHFSMDDFFYPRLSLTITPTAHTGTRIDRPLRRGWPLMACAVPTILAAVLYANLHFVSVDLAQSRIALDNCSAVTHTDTSFITETVIITTTVFSSLPSPAVTSAPLTSTLSQSPEITSLHTSSTIHPTLTPTVSPTPTLVPSEQLPTLPTTHPTQELSFPWPSRFELPPLEIPESARVAVDNVVNGLAVVWQICRRIIHYPLDPP